MNSYKIFGHTTIKNGEEFENILNNLNNEQAIYFLVISVEYAYTQGCFNLSESEIISKSIRKLYLPDIKTDINEKRDE